MSTTPCLDPPELIDTLPTVAELNGRLTRALREVELCRRLLRVARRAAQFRDADRRQRPADSEGVRRGD